MFHKKIMLHGHTGALYALETNSLNNILYSAGSDKLIVAWPFPTMAMEWLLPKCPPSYIVYVTLRTITNCLRPHHKGWFM
nr:hypothetical protein [Bacteroidota bacterium]